MNSAESCQHLHLAKYQNKHIISFMELIQKKRCSILLKWSSASNIVWYGQFSCTYYKKIKVIKKGPFSSIFYSSIGSWNGGNEEFWWMFLFDEGFLLYHVNLFMRNWMPNLWPPSWHWSFSDCSDSRLWLERAVDVRTTPISLLNKDGWRWKKFYINTQM